MDTVMRCHGACQADVSHKPEPMVQAEVTASEPCRGKSKLMVGVGPTRALMGRLRLDLNEFDGV